MGEVVRKTEFDIPRVVIRDSPSALSHLVEQMYTDAVFCQDIRVIQTIINRIDGGLPKDTEVEDYQTLFGDCMNQVLAMTRGDQLKVVPSDTVMLALCKSLYSIASADIYHEMKSDKFGNRWARKVTPSTEKKQGRDSALRLVLERAGGRKTAVLVPPEKLVGVDVADWIKQALPGNSQSEEGRIDG